MSSSLFSITGKPTLSTTYGTQKSIKKVNQYLLVCSLGEGSYAKVYLGRDVDTGKEYAVKRIHLKELARMPAGITQLEREIQIMRRLDHPNLVSLKEVIHIPEKNIAYLVIAYADCLTLSSAMESTHHFTDAEIRAVFAQVARGVLYLHNKGIVHQDLKPSNILLKSDGTAMISDFGIGHSFQSAAMVVGSPAYQAPEVIDECFYEKDTDPGKEDIWSLGVTLYELAFRELPFSGATVFEIVRSIMTSTLEKPKGANDSLWSLISGMLKVGPSQRFSIHDVIAHEYVANADLSFSPKLAPFKPPGFDPQMPITEIHGNVCGEFYTFVVPNKRKKEGFHAFQPASQPPGC